MYETSFLTGANVAMVVVTNVLVQILKFFLPSPPPVIGGAPVRLFSVDEMYGWIPFISAFFIGVILSFIFDPHVGQSFKGKLGDGLQTGAYAIVTWEAYSQTFQKIIERIRDRK